MTRDPAALDKAKDKIRKLLALGTSPNEHEAAAAVAMAHKLLADFDLSMESIDNLKSDSRTSIHQDARASVSTTEGKPDGWKQDLFSAVATTSDCFMCYTTTRERTPSGKERKVKHGHLIGFKHDVELAAYCQSFLVAEIERLAQAYADSMWADIRTIERDHCITHQAAESFYTTTTGRHPLKAKLSFLKGATTSAISKLYDDYFARNKARAEAAAAEASNPFAITIASKRNAVEEFIYQQQHNGETLAAARARWAAEREAWAAAHPSKEEDAPPPESPADKAKREKREAAQRERDTRHWEARMRAEAKRTDFHAYRAGTEAGADIHIAKGLPGTAPGQHKEVV